MIRCWQHATRRVHWLALTVLLLGFGGSATPALANGTPLRAELRYDPAISTWGPRDARGTAEVIRAEGEVTLEIHGLTPLDGGTYAFWLLGPGEQTLRVLDFQAGGGPVTQIRETLPEAIKIPDRPYERMLITVEAAAGATAPSDRRGLTGPISRPQPPLVVPRALPRTGSPSGVSLSLGALGAGTLLALGGAALIAHSRGRRGLPRRPVVRERSER